MPVTISGDGTITGLALSSFEDVDTSALVNGQFLQYNASDDKWVPEDVSMKEKRIAAFTGNGTWTVPAGVTYAIAHMMGGGGGVGTSASGSDGSLSSVAFASGTVSAPGASKVTGNTSLQQAVGGAANSGQSASAASITGTGTGGFG